MHLQLYLELTLNQCLIFSLVLSSTKQTTMFKAQLSYMTYVLLILLQECLRCDL